MNAVELNDYLAGMAGAEVEYLQAYKLAGEKIIQEVYDILEKFSNYVIHRKVISGSIGKNTSLGPYHEPDFDVVIFVIGERQPLIQGQPRPPLIPARPPLEPIVDEFFSILQSHVPTLSPAWKLFKPCEMSKTPFSIKFYMIACLNIPSGMTVKIEFDLLPAVSFSNEKGAGYQTRETLRQIKATQNPEKDWNHWSTSLCEETIKFVNTQSPQVHFIIRLAKLWDAAMKEELKNNGQRFHFSGRSSVIELIAIHAATVSTQPGKTIMLQMFRRFLLLLQNIDNMCIYFNTRGEHFCKRIVQVKIRDERPLILDSVNPYNNYSKKINKFHKEMFKQRATRTLNQLDRVEKGPHFDTELVYLKPYFA